MLFRGGGTTDEHKDIQSRDTDLTWDNLSSSHTSLYGKIDGQRNERLFHKYKKLPSSTISANCLQIVVWFFPIFSHHFDDVIVCGCMCGL